ncbi:DsbA family protein [Paracoccus aminophilus]|uniref:Thiol:disulfide interchange protein DsbA n=1 Tax=Paracoccus aminophilus JCM 7686 TaxID=1367847 RepID=S5Y6D0_PARAH|nr:DsbA family protein [Paracoccus aminophilus]AGT11185.1 thiol:disulfide interchange protein DsbA [Paracoccus aminophilus JCM 7686]
MTVMSRRALMKLGLASTGALTLGARAGFGHENPMPDALRQALERAPFAPVLGNPEGDVTLTEFFDYNCPFCRTSVPVMKRVIDGDKKLRVVFREWPIFGEGSIFATKASLATLKQGKYWAFHERLMAIKGKANEQSVMEVVRAVGLDETRLKRDMESDEVLGHIDHSMQLGEHLGLAGTPSFIAGHEGLFGKQEFSAMTGLIAKARTDLL